MSDQKVYPLSECEAVNQLPDEINKSESGLSGEFSGGGCETVQLECVQRIPTGGKRRISRLYLVYL